ncbi:MAG: hypothetical protein SW833_13685 [Cyanobacteriota bacterium]|nr:hypothetical protein [Cyanobacteriota bacterium]
MNPTVNRSSESPQPSSNPSPKPLAREVRSSKCETDPSISTKLSTPADSNPVIATAPLRNHPIPPPSDPRQYRAIGLIRGCYQPTEESLTRGTLVSTDGTPIDAVLLGRAIGVVKNHLDLTVPHLWVVYPRTRKDEENLHVQIVGVWEPEVLGPRTEESPDSPAADASIDSSSSDSSSTQTESELKAEPESENPMEPESEAQTEPELEASEAQTQPESEVKGESESKLEPPAPKPPPPPPKSPEPEAELTQEPILSVKDGYFSIRGEAIFYSKEGEKLIIKVQQAPRKDEERGRYFKLTLQGVVPQERVLGHFWDVQVMLQGNTLAIEEATDIGAMPVKKRKSFSKNRNSGRKPGRRKGPPIPRDRGPNARPLSKASANRERPPLPKPTKPTKRNRDNPSQEES